MPNFLASKLRAGQMATATIRLQGMAALDASRTHPQTGRFVLLQDGIICGGGMVDLTGIEDQRMTSPAAVSGNLTAVDPGITPQERTRLNGHKGGVIWLTGLSGAGKSTLALALQHHLFARGCQVYVLDGDNIRMGLSKDLGFSAGDRSENIRRIGEVAALFADAGVIVVTAFISPYDSDRKRARASSAKDFHLVHVDAGIDVCEARDPKGLYKKARSGEIRDFTGISAPYESPGDPDLVIDTGTQTVENCVARLIDYVSRQFLSPRDKA